MNKSIDFPIDDGKFAYVIKSQICAIGNRELHQEVCEAVLVSSRQTALVKVVWLCETKTVPGLGLLKKHHQQLH